MGQKIHYIYHWNRIFGAFTALVLLVCLVSYGVYSLVEAENPAEPQDTPRIALINEPSSIDNSPPQNEVSPGTPTQHEVLPRTTDIANEDKPQRQSNESSIEPAAPLPGVSKVARLPVIELESDPLPVDSATRRLHQEPTLEVSKTQTDQTFSTDKVQPRQQADLDIKARQSEQSEPNRAELPQLSESGRGFQLQEINRISPSVKRFTLARAIVDREPVGSIDSITTDTKGIAAIYAFSEIINMGDHTLYYHWFYNDKEVAKVSIAIGKDRWRSYSSKYINKKMAGSWLVELRTEDGQKLASAKFIAGIPAM